MFMSSPTDARFHHQDNDIPLPHDVWHPPSKRRLILNPASDNIRTNLQVDCPQVTNKQQLCTCAQEYNQRSMWCKNHQHACQSTSSSQWLSTQEQGAGAPKKNFPIIIKVHTILCKRRHGLMRSTYLIG